MAPLLAKVGEAFTPIEWVARRLVRVTDPPAITRPVIIFGVERSGTTLLYSVLSNHPSFYWLSRLDSLAPKAPALTSAIRRTLDRTDVQSRPYLAIPKSISKSEGFLPPSECIPYWKLIFGWGSEEIYLVGDDCFSQDDLDPEMRRHILADFQIRLHCLGKSRLLIKQPGFSLKIPYLNALFPDAIFLHVIRHPFDNILSLVSAKSQSDECYWGTKIPEWRKYIGSDLYIQSAIQIKTILNIVNRHIAIIPNYDTRYYQIKYEDLVNHPQSTIAAILDFCGLSAAESIDASIARVVPRERRHSSDIRSKAVSDIIADLCRQYDYAWDSATLSPKSARR